jgi:hypothetical protein
MPFLIKVIGSDGEQNFTIADNMVRLGSDTEDLEIQLACKSVAKFHAVLDATTEELTLHAMEGAVRFLGLEIAREHYIKIPDKGEFVVGIYMVQYLYIRQTTPTEILRSPDIARSNGTSNAGATLAITPADQPNRSRLDPLATTVSTRSDESHFLPTSIGIPRTSTTASSSSMAVAALAATPAEPPNSSHWDLIRTTVPSRTELTEYAPDSIKLWIGDAHTTTTQGGHETTISAQSSSFSLSASSIGSSKNQGEQAEETFNAIICRYHDPQRCLENERDEMINALIMPCSSKRSATGSASEIAAAAETAHMNTIATINEELYYMKFKGVGALKYSPVACSRINDLAACENIILRRRPNATGFSFQIHLKAECTDTRNKIIVVPTIGCPAELTELPNCKQLLWAAHAKERPTYLIVHKCEATIYMKNIRENMDTLGVGIASWESTDGLFGFGASRLAAQMFAERIGHRSLIVMCDVNVLDAPALADGYETPDDVTSDDDTSDDDTSDDDTSDDDTSDEPSKITKKSKIDADKPSKSTKKSKIDALEPEAREFPAAWSTSLYVSPGRGSGIPLRKFKGDTTEVIPGKKGGSDNRPIEQLVMVSDELLYDPCFVTSSEDFDLMNEYLFDQDMLRNKRLVMSKTTKLLSIANPQAHTSYKKKKTAIEKVLFEKTPLSHAYVSARRNYLLKLAHEDNYLVMIGNKTMSIAEVVISIRTKLGKDGEIYNDFALELRSLIIDKILLVAKQRLRIAIYEKMLSSAASSTPPSVHDRSAESTPESSIAAASSPPPAKKQSAKRKSAK